MPARRRTPGRDRTGGPLRLLTAAGAGYLLGTVPSADVASRLAAGGALDLRRVGTGNPGGANAAMVLGRGWGYAVMAADIAKGAAAARLGGRLAGATGAHLAGTASVVGHCFPVWSGFRGGKGVGCSVGQALATFPVYVPVDLAVAAMTVLPRWRRRSFVATLAASSTWVAAAVLWWRRRWPNAWGPTPSAALPLAAAASSAIIAYRFATSSPPPPPEPGRPEPGQPEPPVPAAGDEGSAPRTVSENLGR